MDIALVLIFLAMYLTLGWCWVCILVRLVGLANLSRQNCWFAFLLWPLSIIATDANLEENDGHLLRNLTAKTFNQRFPVDSQFHYYLTPCIGAETVITRPAARHMRNGRLVVRVEGKIGGISVSKMKP